MAQPFDGYRDLSSSDSASESERALVLRAINTERNNLVKRYALKENDFTPEGAAKRPLGYFDQPFTIDETFTKQLIALNRFEARLQGCERCWNNADDFEHYHSEVCDPLYVEDATNVPSLEQLHSAGYGLIIGRTNTLLIEIVGEEGDCVAFNPRFQQD